MRRLLLIAVAVWLSGCVTQSRSVEEVGYTPWCEDKAPLLGDDC